MNKKSNFIQVATLSKAVNKSYIKKIKKDYPSIYVCKTKTNKHTVLIGPVSNINILDTIRSSIDKGSFVRTISNNYMSKSCIKY